MTQEEKQLLLQDLCARLPYGVKVYINSPIEEQNSMELFDVNLDGEHIGVGNKKWAFRAIPIIDNEDETKVVKPYLRPMSSMTEEEKEEIKPLFSKFIDEFRKIVLVVRQNKMALYQDWLNAHHFDYRGLIPKGLAIAVTEENNPYKE